ncbi:MAG: phosphatase PAP2 family protein [Thermodesulfobacteriota bacterium]
MRRIAPVQGLTLIFLVALFILVLISRYRIPSWSHLLFFYFLLLGLLFVLKVSSDKTNRSRTIEFLYSFSPILYVILIYQSLGDIIHYLREDIDSTLIQIDLFIFGVHPTVWMERFVVPWLTDLMSFFYGSYYFLPVILVFLLYLKRRIPEFNEAIFVLTFGYYLSFVGYILFPAIGPRFTLAHLQSVSLDGSLLTDLVRDVLNYLEHNKRDCMPSGHTQIVLMVLYLAYRYERVLFFFYLPIVCGLILSTVYLRYHYVVDLFAGAITAIGCIVIAPRIYERWKFYRELS